jgi:hypothetical protein
MTTQPAKLEVRAKMTDEKITRLITTLREWGGKNTIHPHSGTWMLDAADAIELLSASKPAMTQPVDSAIFVQPVPDHCDRIVWRGSYYGLPPAAPAQSGEPFECTHYDAFTEAHKQVSVEVDALRETLGIKAAPQPSPTAVVLDDGRPRHVGGSNFEGWYQDYAARITGNPKQTARDAYAAGLTEAVQDVSTGRCFFCGESMEGQHEADCPQSPQPVGQTAEPVAWTADSLYDAIEKVLLSHKLSNWQDQYENLLGLVDRLCDDNAHDISSGQHAIRLICDEIYNEVLTVAQPVEQTRALTEDTRDAEILRTLIHRTHACDLKFDKAGKVRALHAVFKADSEPGYGMKSSVRRYLDAFMQDAAMTAARPASGETE